MIIIYFLILCLAIISISFFIVPDNCKRSGGKIQEKNCFYVVVVCSLVDLLAMLLSHRILFGYWDMITTLRNITERTFIHHQLDNIPTFFLLVMVLALLVGYGIRSGLEVFWDIPKIRMKAKSRAVIIMLESFLILNVMVMYYYCFDLVNQIKINEVYISNGNTAINDAKDYVEIRNNCKFPYEFSRWYLSDDENNLKKMEIAPNLIESNRVILVSLDENKFSLSRTGGDKIILSDENGFVVDEVELGILEKNKSYTLDLAKNVWENRKPTPGINNYGLEKPIFSVESGFYDSEFEVTIQTSENAKIYYTTDGSIPTENSEVYVSPISVYDRSAEPNVYNSIKNVALDYNDIEVDMEPVDKGFVLRAVAINDEGYISETTTATYFVGLEEYKNIHVVSLVVEPEDFFGEDGIHVTGKAYDDWYLNGQNGEAPIANFMIGDLECAGNVEIFTPDSQLLLNQECGLRIQGATARKVLKQKRLSIFAREEYSGSDYFDETIFEGKNTHSVVLRKGTTNAFSMELVQDRDITSQRSHHVFVFLNGEYWYETFLQEKYSDEFFEDTYKVKEVEFYKAGITQEIIDFLEKNDVSEENVYRELNQIVDIQSYIEFIGCNVYMGNADYSESIRGGNSVIWRTTSKENDSYGDGRWRWALYDMDLCNQNLLVEGGFVNMFEAQLDSFNYIRSWTIPVTERMLFSNLKKNEEFRRQFVLNFMDLANTVFRLEEVEKIIPNYNQNQEYYWNFYDRRAEFITKYLANVFELKGDKERVTVSTNLPEAGDIVVNTCKPNMESGSWSGEYFTDYPISITAVPSEGYRFAGWEGSIETKEEFIEIDLSKGAVYLDAVFEKME